MEVEGPESGVPSSTLVFFVNGKKIIESRPDPEWSLLYYLRNKLGLKGAKEGCGEGGCGSCTVMMSRLHRESKVIRHHSVMACLVPVTCAHGQSVITVEGLGTAVRGRLHPTQERLVEAHGTQCGFCTPGFVMSMYALLRSNPHPTITQIEDNLAGNLCRCTGYRPILEGFSSFTSDGSLRPGCGKKDCCQIRNQENTDDRSEQAPAMFNPKNFAPYDPSQEVVFPPELMLNDEYDTEELVFSGPRLKWYRPVSLEQLLRFKTSFPEADIIVGNTEAGILKKFKNIFAPVQIDPSKVVDLLRVTVCKTGVILGAALPLSRVEDELKKVVDDLPEFKTRGIQSLLEMLRWFGNTQIKNVASLGGNIMACSPVGDLTPLLVASEAQLKFQCNDSERKVTIDESFFTGYRTNGASKHEVLIDVFIPFTNKNTYVMGFKQSRRRIDDIAIVNAGFKVILEDVTRRVERLILCFGGMDERIVVAMETMQGLYGLEWNESLMQKGVALLLKDLPLSSSAPGGMVEYRRTLCLSFFFKFFTVVSQRLDSTELNHVDKEDKNVPILERLHPQRYQSFATPDTGPVGQPMVHSSAFTHATGEAVFVDDLLRQERELSAALVLSAKASAKIIKVDASDAAAVDGFVGFYSAKDLTGKRNKTGAVIDDEEVFASEEVKYVGEVVGIVVAEDKLAAEEAAQRVKICYQENTPILTTEDALKANSTWPARRVHSGNIENGFKSSDHTLKGELRVGGQEHFYMETQTCLAIPLEGGDMEIISATQNPSDTQRNVAQALGQGLNRVVCRTKRLGGGFGGKEIKAGRIATYAAVAASETGRPVRLTLDRDVDMQTTGGRHPVVAQWKVGFKNDGSLVALRLQIFANSGYSLDISDSIAVKALLHADNVYRIPNTDISFTCCKTNLASNTACRGAGSPQSMLIMEDIITRVAAFLNMKPHQVREINMYQGPNPHTYYGGLIDNCTVKQCWDQVLAQSDFHQKRKRVQEFNANNQFIKRGVSAVPSKMAASFGCLLLQQSGALIHVYTDGSVMLTHGGVEMGQGLHTKMMQIISKEFSIPMEMINLMETSTDKIPNTSPTAASTSSDLNGMAVKSACEQILARLKPYREKNPSGKWSDWVQSAYEDRVSLLGAGFYKNPGLLDFDFEKQSGNPYNYFTFGAAVTEVEVDLLTGDHTVLQTDIVMDAGQSLNPAIDIGQIEGAFMFGYGMFTLEEMLYNPKGKLLTSGPGSYKIPCVEDIPRTFNVSLLKDSSNPRGIFSSRGVGEPPLFLASSVFFAIKDALASANGPDANFRLDSPATCERIRMAIDDKFLNMVMESKTSSGDPWCIRV